MSTTVAFLAETPGSPTIQEQRTYLSPDDIEVLAGRKTFNHLADLLSRKGVHLSVGDRVKIHDLSCVLLPTPMLIRAAAKLLKAGISLEICSPAIVIEAECNDRVQTMLEALDTHYRHLHGIKTHPPEMAQPGRKRLLDPEKLPEIREKLNVPGATTTDVAEALGVARSTLFNYLERYDIDRRVNRNKKAVNSDSEDRSDEVEVARQDSDRPGV